MKIYFNDVKNTLTISYNSHLQDYCKDDAPVLRKINKMNGEIHFSKVDNVLICKLNLLVECLVVSSYTNIPFNYKMELDEELFFTDSKEMDSDELIYTKDEIDLDYYVYSLVLTSIPINVHKKGETIYRDDSDDSQEEVKSSPFDVLEGIDFEK